MTTTRSPRSPRSPRTRVRIAAALAFGSVLATAALASPAGAANSAVKKRSATATQTLTIAQLPGATVTSGNARWQGGSITAEQGWAPVAGVVGDKPTTGTVTADLELTAGGRGPRGTLRGQVAYTFTFKDVLVSSFTGMVRGTYRCANLECTIEAKVTKPGQPNQIIAILIGLAKAKDNRYAEYEEIALSYEKITWTIVSPRDPASGLPTGKRGA